MKNLLLILFVLFSSSKTLQANEKCQQFADFKLRQVSGPLYSNVDLKAEQYDIKIISFFQDICLPCHKEAILLKKISNELGKNKIKLVFIGESETRKSAYKFMRKRGLLVETVLANPYNSFKGKYDLAKLPTVFVLDKSLKVLKTWNGLKKESELRDLLKSLHQNSNDLCK